MLLRRIGGAACEVWLMGKASEKTVEEIRLGMKTRKTVKFTCINIAIALHSTNNRSPEFSGHDLGLSFLLPLFLSFASVFLPHAQRSVWVSTVLNTIKELGISRAPSSDIT